MTAPSPQSPLAPFAVDPADFCGRGLVCVRGGRVVFADVSFDLAPGGALLLLGANGAGKSSLLRLMAGLSTPAAGTIQWAGASVHADRQAHAERTRWLGHQDAIKPVLSVLDNMAAWVAAWRPDIAEARRACQVALERLGLSDLRDVPGRYLSAGQKRRVALARLLAAPAPLWLFDEPATALDQAALGVLETLIAEHRAQGGMVALSTHASLAIPKATILRLTDYGREDAA